MAFNVKEHEIEIEGRTCYVANPGDDWSGELYRFGFGACGPTVVYAWGRGVRKALEEAAGFLKDAGKVGLFSEPDYGAARDELGSFASDDDVTAHAEKDLTYTESGWLLFCEWTVNDASDEEIAAVNDAHLAPMRAVAKAHAIQVWHGKHYRCDDCEAEASDRDYIDHDDDHADSCDPENVTESEGWFWQTCHPGCLPDSDVMGPFKSEREAMEDATDGLEA